MAVAELPETPTPFPSKRPPAASEGTPGRHFRGSAGASGKAPSWPGWPQLQRPKRDTCGVQKCWVQNPWRLLREGPRSRARASGGPTGGRKAARAGGALVSLARKAEPPGWEKRTVSGSPARFLIWPFSRLGPKTGFLLPPDTAGFSPPSQVNGRHRLAPKSLRRASGLEGPLALQGWMAVCLSPVFWPACGIRRGNWPRSL